MDNISTFSVPGGHRLYMDMREKIEHDYWQVPRKGVKVRSRKHRNGDKIKTQEHSHAGHGVNMSRKHGNMVKMRRRELESLAQREGYVPIHEHITLLKRSQNT